MPKGEPMSDLGQLKRQSRALLVELGSSADEVFGSLESASVRGIPKDNRSCPVALYLSALMGSHPRVRAVKVGHCSVLIDTVASTDSRPTGRLLVQLPKAVRRFVAAFDAGQYPGIIRERPEDAAMTAVASSRSAG
jgi:hypothetical protein